MTRVQTPLAWTHQEMLNIHNDHWQVHLMCSGGTEEIHNDHRQEVPKPFTVYV